MEVVVYEIDLKNETRTEKKWRNLDPSLGPTCRDRRENSGLEGKNPECEGADY